MTRKAFLRTMAALALSGALMAAPALPAASALAETPAALTEEADSAAFETAAQSGEKSSTEVAVHNPAETSLCTLYVNGVKRSSKPFYQGRTLMLPLRAVVESSAKWHYAYGSKTAVFGPKTGSEYSVVVGKNSYRYGGRAHKLDYAPLFADNRVYVPWQYMEFALGFKVTIHDDGRIDVKTSTHSRPDAAEKTLSIRVNGKKVSGTPYYSGKTLMVPLRPIVTALGYRYDYSNEQKFSVFSAKGINTHIFWGENSYPIDNQYSSLEKEPVIRHGSLFVPASYVQKALKCSVKLSGTTLRISR